MDQFSKNTLTIDLGKVVNNYNVVRGELPSNTLIGAVVKANAYGLGARKISKALDKIGCSNFFVSTLQEASELLDITKANIYLLHGVEDRQSAEFCVHNELIPVLNHLGQISIWNNIAKEKDRKLRCILHLETGLGRLGLSKKEQNTLLSNSNLMEYLEPIYIMSHMACAEQCDHPINQEQLKNFNSYLKNFPGIKASLSNSAGIFLGPEYQFDLVRPGCALFGINPTSHTSNPLQPVIELKAHVLQHKILEKEQNIGYRSTHKAKKGDKLLVLQCGYADGFSRFMSNKGFCYAHGKFLPIVGIIGMDMTIVDASSLSENLFFETNYVELLGENITIDDIGKYADNIGYELLITKFTNRIKRIYIND